MPFFVLRIKIINVNDYTIQLKKRHKYIFNSSAIKGKGVGIGVVGMYLFLFPASRINIFRIVTLKLLERCVVFISWNDKLIINDDDCI